MENKNNPLLCDPETGVCEITPAQDSMSQLKTKAEKKPVKIVYFTDPICSSCWGIEPQLRKLKLEYAHITEVEYHMGGLLPDWSYNSGGISKPADVAHHWDEVSAYYQMPIDGDVWLEDPLASSYPPSIAFKAAQLQDPKKAVAFLRIIREQVFLEKKNITRWEHLSEAALQAGLDTVIFKKDYEKNAEALFRSDLELARKWGVRGFPSVFVMDSTGKQVFVYGFKPYSEFENAILTVFPEATKTPYLKDPVSLFSYYPTLTLREFAELSGTTMTEAEQILNKMVKENVLTLLQTKNGNLYKIKH